MTILRLLLLLACCYSANARQLIQVQAVFRHAARAPIFQFTSQEASRHFFRGLGQLSELGISQSLQLGELLASRYVKSGFVDERFIPAQVQFRSSPVERTLMTAQEVGRGMFRREIPVPVSTYPSRDKEPLLYPLVNCEATFKAMKEFTGFSSWPEIFVALREKYGPSLNGSRDYLEAVKVESFEGLRLPDWAYRTKTKSELEDVFYEFMMAIGSGGKYARPELVRPRAGRLVYEVQDLIEKGWRCYENSSLHECGTIKKFYYYSTHDTVTIPFAEAFNLTSVWQNRVPPYASGFIIELYEDNGDSYVEVFYRQSPGSQALLPVTEKVRNCHDEGSGDQRCSLKSFLDCCGEYKTQDMRKECGLDNKGFCWKTFLLWSLVVLVVLLLIAVIFLGWLLARQNK